MGTVLLVEDRPDLGLFEAGMLEQDGHRVIRCSGAPTPLEACTLLRCGNCPIPSAADVLVFSVPLYLPIRGRTYRGIDLLHAYRRHPTYARRPMLVVSVGDPGPVEGTGTLELIEKHGEPRRVVEAIERLMREREEVRS